jgi:hypothetical protein
MKRCPACDRVYEDNAMSFCLEDGTPLFSSPPYDPGATMQIPTEGVTGQALSEVLTEKTIPSIGHRLLPSEEYKMPAQAKPSEPKKIMPLWILGAALILGLSAIIVALIATRNTGPNGSQVAQKTGNVSQASNANAGSSVNRPLANVSANANSNRENANNPNNASANRNISNNESQGNANSDNGSAAAPTNHDEVLQDLKAFEDKWNEANIKGDKATLNYMLATEYKGTNGGRTESKKQYIATAKPERYIVSETSSNLNLTLTGNNAVLKGMLLVVFKKGVSERYSFTDTYIWRDGRWQAISSQASRVK